MDTAYNLREAEPIEPGELFSLKYADTEVLDRLDDRRVRRVNLDKAVTLGKSTHIKTRLVLLSNKGFVQVSGIVHAVSQKGVTLNGDHFIPMHVIYSVDMEWNQ